MEDKDYVFDLNDVKIEPLDPKKLIHMMQQTGVLPMDPTKTMSHVHDTTVYKSPPPTYVPEGVWSQIKSTTYSPSKTMLERMESLEVANKLLRVDILVLKNKFTEEEGNNIKAMLISNDEASITVAETILENL